MWNVDSIKPLVEGHILIPIGGDFCCVVRRNLYQFTYRDECHCTVYMLVINREIVGTPAMEPENSKNRAAVWKMRQKAVYVLVRLKLVFPPAGIPIIG